MNNDLISIIVPIYNSEAYLEKCINSIILQTYKNWELLLINDGSIDHCKEICNSYAEVDRRIKVFHKENEGVSTARNIGIDNAKGKWIAFIDSDDFVREKYLENLLSHTSDNVDLVISYAEWFYNDTSKKNLYPSKLVQEDRFYLIFTENGIHYYTAPWSKLFRLDLINEIKLRFDCNIHCGEDLIFFISYMLKAKSIYISSDTDYCYNVETPGSLVKSLKSAESELYSFKRISETVDLLIDCKNIKNKDALKNLDWIKVNAARRVLNAVYKSRLKRKERLNILSQLNLSKNINEIYSDKCYKNKIFKIVYAIGKIKTYDCFKQIVTRNRYTKGCNIDE